MSGVKADRSARLERAFDRAISLFLCLSIMVGLSVVYYGYSLIDFSARWAAVVGGTGAIFSIACAALLFGRRDVRINGGFALLSTATCLVALNLILESIKANGAIGPRLLDDPLASDPWKLAIAQGLKVDRRPMLQVVLDMRAEGKMVYPATMPIRWNYRSDPNFDWPLTAGISNVETVMCNESGQWLTYRSDRYGFNNDDSVYDRNGKKILLIGDSFTHGYCNPTGDDFAGFMRGRGIAAINAGVGANGPLIELATLKEYAPAVKPSHVLWMFYYNDLTDLWSESRYEKLLRYLDQDFSLGWADRQNDVDRIYKALFESRLELVQRGAVSECDSWLWKAVTLFNVRRVLGLYSSNFMPEGWQRPTTCVALQGFARNFNFLVSNAHAGQPLTIGQDVRTPLRGKYDETIIARRFRSILAAAQRFSAGMGATFHVVLIPRYSYCPCPSPEDQRKLVLKMLADLGIPFFDLEDDFLMLRSLPPEQMASAFPHWKTTVGGHFTLPVQRFLAEALTQWVKTHVVAN